MSESNTGERKKRAGPPTDKCVVGDPLDLKFSGSLCQFDMGLVVLNVELNALSESVPAISVASLSEKLRRESVHGILKFEL